MAKKAVKRIAVAVPRSREEVSKLIAEIGKHQRALAGINTALNAQIERIKSRAVREGQPHEKAIGENFEKIFIFAQANRDELTEGGKTKTVYFPPGIIAWRTTPPGVFLRGVKQIIAACKKLGLYQFIRTKETVDKVAMLKEKDKAVAIKGVIITQREEFVVKPSEVGVEISKDTKKLRKKTDKKS